MSAGAQVTLTSGATVVVGADGTLHYDAGAGFAHLARGETATDWLAYTAVDGHGGVSETSVSISIAGRNDPPQAMSDAISTDASTRLAIAPSTLLANDSDPDTGDAIHFVGLDAGSAVGVVSFDGAHINYDPAGRFQGLGEGETAIDAFTYRIADHDGAIATGNVAVTVHGRNDPPAAFDDSGATDEDTPITLTVLSNDSDPDLHDRLTVTSITTSGTRGQVTLNADGSITYDPRGHFDGLNAGQTDHDSFTYTIADGHGSTAAATVSVDIAGRSDTERLVESFEAAIPSGNRSSSYVATTDQYQETDGARGLYQPTDGLSMARLEAIGTLAQPLESFLGLPSRSLPKDPVDSTIAANGSALKLKLSVEAGDQISFDWMFDARDFVSTPPDGKSDDDYAIFTVAKSGNAELFKLSEVRQTGDQGASGWRSSIYTATAAGELTIGFGVINDRVADSPREHNSFLLVDNVRLNRDFGTGYQIVDHQSDGHFETLVHHA